MYWTPYGREPVRFLPDTAAGAHTSASNCYFGSVKFYWLLLLLPVPAFAQQATVMTDYDAAQLFNAVAEQTAKLAPMIEQINTADWVGKGAPPTYVQLRNGALAQNKAIVNAMHELAQHPSKLSECLSALFRIQSMEMELISLDSGLRKYQNPALADLIGSLLAEGNRNRDRFRQYVVDLAGNKEQQFEVADKEAQRCRESLSKGRR
jgi:hypothetical protein